jgi:hypothetical protein
VNEMIMVVVVMLLVFSFEFSLAADTHEIATLFALVICYLTVSGSTIDKFLFS